MAEVVGCLHAIVGIWFAASVVIGGIWLACDEWRFKRESLGPGELEVEVDRSIRKFGTADAAYWRVGELMLQARCKGDFRRYRFLRQVSGAIAARLIQKPD